MVNNEPLIPPPSIGESAESKAIPKIKPPKKRGSKLWLVVLACVVVGVGLGVVVYQQSIVPAPQPSTTPRATVAPRASPIPSPAMVPPEINAITPKSNKIAFPKAGEVRVYFSNYENKASVLLDLKSTSGSVGVQMAGNGSTTTMSKLDTGFVLKGAEEVTIGLFDGGDYAKPGFGWIPPNANNTCGGDGSTVHPSITTLLNYAKTEAGTEPLVSVQCWSDWSPNTNGKDTSVYAYNEYFVIWSYVPVETTSSPSPSPSASVVASASPSPSASTVASATPTPSPSPSPTPNTSVVSTVTPTPSPRAAQPEASTLPDAGVFEITIGTVSLGLIFLVLGLVGLLAL